MNIENKYLPRPGFAALALVLLLIVGAAGTEITRIDIRFALMVQDMARHGWGCFPTINGVEYGDYPSGWVFLAYLTTLGGRFMYLPLLALPCIAAGALTIAATWLTGERIGKNIGLYAAAFLLVTPEFLMFFTGFGMDIPVMLAGAVMLCLLLKKTSTRLVTGVFALLLCFAFFTRGPMGVVILGAGTGGFLLAERDWKKLVSCGLAGAVTAAVCLLLWRGMIYRQGGADLWNWFLECQFLSRMGKSNYTTYFIEFIFLFAPTTPVALCLPFFAQTRRLLRPLAGLIGYILLPLIVLSIPACKHSRYMAITLPAFALIAGAVWREFLAAKRGGAIVSKIQNFLAGRITLITAAAILILAGVACLLTGPAKVPWVHFCCAVLLIAGLERFQRLDLRGCLAPAAVCIALTVAVFPFAASLENARDFVADAERDCTGQVYFYELGPDHDDLKYVLAIPPDQRKKIHYLYAALRPQKDFYQKMYPAETLADRIAAIAEEDIVILRDRARELEELRAVAERHNLSVNLKNSGSMGHRDFLAVRLIRRGTKTP